MRCPEIIQIIMKKIFLSFALFAGLNFVVSAQEKISVGIMPFANLGGGANEQDVIAIQEAVTSAFVKAKRFKIVDRTKMDELQKEKNLQKSEDYIDGNVIRQGVSLGANFLVSGKVISVSKSSGHKDVTKSDGTKVSEPVNEANINFSCQIIDVETGEVVNSETFSNSGGGSFLDIFTAKNVDDAFSSSLSSLGRDIDRWIEVNFPAIFAIAEIQEKDSKGNATKILIAGGSVFGLEKGDRLKVVELSIVNVNGKDLGRKKEIGELKVTKVEDENFSICSVKAGGFEISSKFEAKAKLQVITVKKVELIKSIHNLLSK